MNKFLFFLIITLLFIIIPIVNRFYLITDLRVLYVILFLFVLNFSQPALKEKNENSKENDKNSVILIIICTGLSIALSIIDWAYLQSDRSIRYSFLLPGVAINISGLALRVWSIRILGKYFTATVQIKEDHSLVNNGPYKILRHPSYTGALLAVIGIAVIFTSWIGVLGTIIFMGGSYYFRIKTEEKELYAFFGEVYKKYTQRTYRMIPFLW